MNQPDRVAVLGALAAMDRELGLIGSYIDREGHEREAILLEDAQRSLLAAQCLLDRDIHRVIDIVPKGRLNSNAGT